MKDRNNVSKIGVKVDRCWNRNWRCYICVLTGILAAMAIYLWYKDANREPKFDNDAWKNHWSKNQQAGVAKKLVFPPEGGIREESFEQYNQLGQEIIIFSFNNEAWKKHWSKNQQAGVAKKLVFPPEGGIREESFEQYNQRMPDNDDSDYYDADSPSLRKSPVEEMRDYESKFREDTQRGISNIQKPGALGDTPQIIDYSRRLSFRKMFRSTFEDKIDFFPNYKNPCWAESIPKFPYINNSYLDVPAHSRSLDPQLRNLRQTFASRQDPSTRWRTRCLPYFYVMETPPFATPSLFTLLGYHPRIVNPVIDEPEFWNEKGPDQVVSFSDYVDLFDGPGEQIRKNFTVVNIDGKEESIIEKHKDITGDGTSSYLWNFNSWNRLSENLGSTEPIVTVPDLIKRLTPEVKIIMMIRNPTERLFDSYISKTEASIASATDFHNKVGMSIKMMSECVKENSLRKCLYDSNFNKKLAVRLRIGMYFTFLKDWIKTFSMDKILVVRYEDFIKEPSLTISQVCKHLDIEPFPSSDLERLENRMMQTKAKKLKRKIKIMSVTRGMLNEFFKSFNEELAILLDEDKFKWLDGSEEQDELSDTDNNAKEIEINKLNEKNNIRIEELQRETRLLKEQFERERKNNLEIQNKNNEQKNQAQIIDQKQREQNQNSNNQQINQAQIIEQKQKDQNKNVQNEQLRNEELARQQREKQISDQKQREQQEQMQRQAIESQQRQDLINRENLQKQEKERQQREQQIKQQQLEQQRQRDIQLSMQTQQANKQVNNNLNNNQMNSQGGNNQMNSQGGNNNQMNSQGGNNQNIRLEQRQNNPTNDQNNNKPPIQQFRSN